MKTAIVWVIIVVLVILVIWAVLGDSGSSKVQNTPTPTETSLQTETPSTTTAGDAMNDFKVSLISEADSNAEMKKGALITVKFTNEIDVKTITNENIKIDAVSVSAAGAGVRDNVGDLVFEYNSQDKTLVIKAANDNVLLGGCASCKYELTFSAGLRDKDGKALDKTVIGLTI